LAALVVCAGQILVCAGCLLIVRLWIVRTRQQAEEILRVALTSPDKDTPAPLAKLLDEFARLLASRLVQSVKQTISGVESKALQAEGAEVLSQAMEGSPLLALIAGIVPAKIRNKLLRNPQMVGALAKMGQGFTGGSNHSSDSTPSSHQGSFSL
jgi:hypothetical protein